MKIRSKGLNETELFETIESYRKNDLSWRGGKTFSYVYHAGEEAERIAKKAFNMFMSENALDPTVYPSLLRFETEVVSMARAHLNGDDKVVGSFTSGGTESILLAVKTARDRARALKPEIKVPEMVLPVTAHAAFWKAAHYFDVKVVPVSVNPETFRAEASAMEKAITPNTIMLVGSAASFAHGVTDEIEGMGQLALKHDLLLHVDGCIGAFVLPYFRRLGSDIPNFDFSVPGVTSISMDLHKYAYTPKGASVLLWKNEELRRHQLFSCAKWPGYTMINTTVQSTKSGGPMAGAWAVLNHFGDEGYLELARIVRNATLEAIEGIKKIPELRLLGNPDMCLVAFTSDTVDVFHIADEMRERGWFVQAQLAYDNSPSNIHLTIGAGNVDRIQEMLTDLKKSIEVAKTLKKSELAETVPMMLAAVDPKDMDGDKLGQLLGAAGLKKGDVPTRQAEINAILEALSPAMKEAILSEYANQLFQ